MTGFLQSFSLLAAESGPSIHVAPGVVFTIGGLEITNSILYGWISALIIIALLIAHVKVITVRPKKGPIQMVEVAADFISNLVTSTFDDKEKGRKYVPFFVTLFFFILLNNWLGLIPGIGEAVRVGETPLFRGFTADLNATLAIGFVTMVTVYVASIRELGGAKKYFRHFFIGNPLNPFFLVIGLLEMLTDVTQLFSLALRLFLNVTIGEIVIAVFAYLGSLAAPVTALPFTMIEFLVRALQAYIFTVLSVMYLSIAVNHGSHHDEVPEDTLTADPLPETMGMRQERA